MTQELSANTTLSHYRIVSPLGAGGMGEVSLAEDTRRDRRVALKLLPAACAQDAARVRRFMQEAKAASQERMKRESGNLLQKVVRRMNTFIGSVRSLRSCVR